MKYSYSYESDAVLSQKSGKQCKLCGAGITCNEFEYEDYFVLFRGHSEAAFEGFVCFRCTKETGKVQR